MITTKLHWNYFLAIESDLINLTRFIEFNNDNLKTYSIELAHILLSASSEIDAILKQICYLIDKNKTANNINEYQEIIKANLPEFTNEKIRINRYGIEFTPWEKWNEGLNPTWWKSHNNVKHQRNEYFNQANLENTLGAVGALLITVTYYYQIVFENQYKEKKIIIDLNKTTELLKPQTNLLKLRSKYYHHPVYLY